MVALQVVECRHKLMRELGSTSTYARATNDRPGTVGTDLIDGILKLRESVAHLGWYIGARQATAVEGGPVGGGGACWGGTCKKVAWVPGF